MGTVVRREGQHGEQHDQQAQYQALLRVMARLPEF